jgi:CheY-like chemotaxis protein
MMLVDALVPLGFEMADASDGQEALELIANQYPCNGVTSACRGRD